MKVPVKVLTMSEFRLLPLFTLLSRMAYKSGFCLIISYLWGMVIEVTFIDMWPLLEALEDGFDNYFIFII